MEQIAKWKKTAGSDASLGYDGSREYDSAEKGDIFWRDWLGHPYELMPPKLDWGPLDFYNYEDLNRVEHNTEIVAVLVSYFVVLPPLTFLVNRDMQRIDFAKDFNRIEGNQDILRQRYTPLGWMTNKLDWKYNSPFSYVDARRLEINMYLLYHHYKKNTEIVPICGAYICGEEAI